MVQNKGLIFKNPPSGLPKAGKDLAVEARDFDVDQAPPSGGATLKINYISLDPYQRGRMRAPEIKSYSPPFEIGKPITNRAVATVVKSDNPKVSPGDVVVGEQLTFEEYMTVDKAKLERDVKKLDNPHNLDPKLFIGALGMPGLTAYSSLYDIGKPKKGETIFISAASGAVGQLVGQIAKHEGLKVIGSVGDDTKLDFIRNELGFEGFNYKKEKTSEALGRLAPDGIDIYYENVGGETLEAAITAMKPFGRIIACGMISQYNLPPNEHYGIRNLMNVVGKRLTMRGFIVGDPDMGPKYAADHQKTVQKWIHEGTYKPKMSVTSGIDNSIEGLIGLFEGKNFGKAVLEIAPLK
ncbi:NAD(P)-binding protein [Myriangium duriaei CBS 260.36]|uniref:NAD(P)-binding protein n=1 Tax=Myriangium duriaei CBS 260.36 TaxID=1168546 RepID=A0A9P4MJV7_9PEZI|nr:NAD(P)-binding protein [Myriangium duriaei CBS 260.36]